MPRTHKLATLTVYWAPLAVYMCLMWYLSSRPINLGNIVSLPHIDKAVHLLEYVIFACLLCRPLHRTALGSKDKYLTLFVSASGFIWGALDEIHQMYVPTRDASWFDLLFDVVGSACGVRIFLSLIKNKSEA